MLEYIITFECDKCGQTIENRGIQITDENVVILPWDIASQSTFDCQNCGMVYYTGDMDYEEDDTYYENDEEEGEDE